MALPDLQAVLTAKTDGFESALNRSAKAAEDASARIKGSTDKINQSFGLLRGAVEGVAGALSVGLFVNLVKGAIDSADHLNDLSKKTGVAVETLGGFGFAAEQAGGNLDSMAKGLAKLELSLASAAAGNKKAQQGFDVLGISVKDAAGNTRGADKVFADIADKFAGFKDGPEKAALAVQYFGKAGADLISVLDEGGKKLLENVAYFERYSGVTADLAARADEFNDTLAKVNLLSGAFGKQLAGELLPSLQTLANLLVESKEKGTAFATVAEGIGDVFNRLVSFGSDVVFIFSRVGNTIGGLVAQLEALTRLDFGAVGNIQTEIKLDDKKARETLDRFQFDLKNAASQNKATLTGGTFDQEGTTKVRSAKTDAPRIPATGVGRAAPIIDNNKKLLDQQLKELDVYIAREKELLSDRNQALAQYYSRDELSIESYFAARKVARDEDVANTRTAYEKEIADIEKYIATVSKRNDPKGEGKVIDAQTKLIEIREKLRKVDADASGESIKDWFAQDKAVQQYGDRLDALNAQIKALRGDTAGAFKIDFDVQNRSLSKQLEVNRGSNDPDIRARSAQAEIELAEIRRQGLARAQLNDIEKQRGTILGDLQNAQDRINIAVASGASTELQGLQAASEANAARVASLTKVVDAYEAIAAASGDPAAIVQADALRVQLERLASQTDLVADKFNAIGKSATENFIDKLTSGTVKLKDAFKSLFADLNSQLLKVASKNIAESLFGKSGGLGDFGSTISKFLGGSAAKAGGAAGGGIADLIGSFGGKSSGIAAGAGLKSGDTGAFDQSGSEGLAASTAANDDAFKALTGSISTAQGALTTFSQEGIGGAVKSFADYIEKTVFGTVVEATKTEATTSAVGSLVLLSTAADAAASALLAVASSSAASSGGDALGAFIGTLGSAKGNVFSGGNVLPFARGGIVSSPTLFPMANGGTGLMGESGPEAIVPLKRGRDGRLGVAAGGQQQAQAPSNVNIQFLVQPSTPRETQQQIASAAARGLAIASRRNG